MPSCRTFWTPVCYPDDEAVKEAVKEWLEGQTEDFYLSGINSLPVMLVLGLGLGLDSVGRGLDAIMLYTYVLVFVVWNLYSLDTCSREFWLFLPAQPLLRGFIF